MITIILVAAITLLICFGFAWIHVTASQRHEQVEADFAALAATQQSLNAEMAALSSAIEQLHASQTEATTKQLAQYQSIHGEVLRISDEVRGENKMSNAIEMARAGASVKEIQDKSGLAHEDAEALVAFHGPN